MKIAIVGPAHPYKGGGAQHTTELAHRLRALGHDVVIESWKAQYPGFLYPGRQTIDAPESEPFSATNRVLDWRRPDGWYLRGRRLRSADLVILAVLSPVQVPAYLGILAGCGHVSARGKNTARRPGPRVIALCHNVLPHERKPYDRPFMTALLRRVDGVHTHSDEQAALARELTDVPVSVAALAPHLPARGAPAVRDAEPYGRLLFFGIVRPYKGLDLLLRALAQTPDVKLTVAGEFWGGEDGTRALIAELGLAERVDLRPGYVAAHDVPALFAAADALVLPYRSATASQNVWLGHEHGVPVIATRVGALADNVTDGVDGLLADPGSVGALADALKRFYEPGTPARLRSGIRSIDPDPHWSSYLKTLLPS